MNKNHLHKSILIIFSILVFSAYSQLEPIYVEEENSTINNYIVSKTIYDNCKNACDIQDDNEVCETDCEQGPLEVFEHTQYHQCMQVCEATKDSSSLKQASTWKLSTALFTKCVENKDLSQTNSVNYGGYSSQIASQTQTPLCETYMSKQNEDKKSENKLKCYESCQQVPLHELLSDFKDCANTCLKNHPTLEPYFYDESASILQPFIMLLMAITLALFI